MSDNSGTGAFFAGLLLGGLVGAAAALLFTPQSGEETRVQLQTTSSHLKSEVSDKASSLQARGKVIVDEHVTTRGDEENDASADSEEAVAVVQGEDDSTTDDA